MVALLFFLLRLLLSAFRPISRLEAENAALRRQLMVQRQVRGRVQFTNSDRLFFLQLYRWFPSILNATMIIRPETLVRWHRASFCRYGVAVTRRLRAMGIRDKPISAGSPWQNSFAERLIGTVRRECVDHIVVLGEAHLRRILRE